MKCIGNCINCEQEESSKAACCQLQTLQQLILVRKELNVLKESMRFETLAQSENAVEGIE